MAKSTAGDPIPPQGEPLGIHALQALTDGVGIEIKRGAHKDEGHGGINVGIDPVLGILDFSLGGAGDTLFRMQE